MGESVCSNCGTSNREGVRFCTSCGHRLAGAPRPGSAVPVLVPAASGPAGAQGAPALGTAVFRWFTAEHCLYVLLLFFTLLTRVYDVGSRPLHHDESLHATYSYYLYHEGRYAYEPMMHGPFQFHMTAFLYYLFGANDWAARLAPALFGVILVSVPMLLRRELGRSAALWLSFVLFLSGSFFYYSRFLREDIYSVTWTFLTIAAAIKWWRWKEDRALYATAAAFSMAFCTKENAYITAFIAGNFLMVKYNWDLLSRLAQRQQTILKTAFVSLLLASWGVYAFYTDLVKLFRGGDSETGAWLAFGLTVLAIHLAFGALHSAVLLGRLRAVGDDVSRNLRLAHWLLLILATIFVFALLRDVAALRWFLLLCAVLYAAMGIAQSVWARALERPLGLVAVGVALLLLLAIVTGAYAGKGGRALTAVASVAGAVFLLFLLAGYVQSFRKAFWCAVAFLVPFTLLYTTFLTNPRGFLDGYTSSLGYWLTQQKVERGSQPYYFYLPLLWLYELPALVFGVAAMVRYLVHRSVLTTFLIFWTVMSLVMYALAGERMPWLIVHMALPLSVLSAYYLGDKWDRAPRAARGGWVAVFLLCGAFYAHGSFVVNFFHGANPVEPLVYVQTAEDVRRVVREVETLSQQVTGGKDLKICVTSDATWPFPWYFREYPNTQYPSSVPQGGGDFPVILTEWYDADQEKKVRETVGPEYEVKKYHHRVWWATDARTVFPGYKTIKTPRDALDVVRDLQWSKIQWRRLFDLWMYRAPWPDSVNPQVVLGAQEMLFCKKRNLVHKYD